MKNCLNRGLLVFLVILMLSGFKSMAQEKREDGTWWDNGLRFELIYEDIRRGGALEFCIYQSEHDRCIYNLSTAFEVRIFDGAGKEIWNSLWTGKTTEVKFKKGFKEAGSFEIKAINAFVINTSTGTRIYQDKPLTLNYNIPETEK